MILIITKNILNAYLPAAVGSSALDLRNLRKYKINGSALISILESQHYTTVVGVVLVLILVIMCATAFMYILYKYATAPIDLLWEFSIFTETENEINAIKDIEILKQKATLSTCLLYTSPSPRDS